MKKTYAERKAEARQRAIEYQSNEENRPFFWSDVCFYNERFEKLGKRYGLLREFRENGII